MNAKDRTPRRHPFYLMAGIAPLAVALALVGCQAKTGDEATDSLNITTEVPAPSTAPAGGATRFGESSNGQEVVVAPGAEFEVALLSDPTTGMTWAWVDSANSTIVLVERATVLGEGTDGSVSPAGSTVWRFRAPPSGTAPVRMELRRPGETTAAQSYVVTVRAE